MVRDARAEKAGRHDVLEYSNLFCVPVRRRGCVSVSGNLIMLAARTWHVSTLFPCDDICV